MKGILDFRFWILDFGGRVEELESWGRALILVPSLRMGMPSRVSGSGWH